jgi:Fic family protein
MTDLGEARGKQELFTHQAPQKLKVLREHALVESAIASNRIEGVEVDQKRVGTIVFGKKLLKDRNEEEVRGYREALQLIHENNRVLTVSEDTIRELHRLTRGNVGDAGEYKKKDVDIIEKIPGAEDRIRFRSVPAKKTPQAMKEWVELNELCLEEGKVHPLLVLAASNLDFLCIHPFRDGNGRVSRLLLLLQCYRQGFEVGRYISLERLIEQNKDRYYETLEESSRGWHEGKHDPWPYINYLFFILKEAYKEFEARVGNVSMPRGSKTEMLLSVVGRQHGPFTVAALKKDCPTVGLDMIRALLKKLKAQGKVERVGMGRNAQWKKGAKWL